MIGPMNHTHDTDTAPAPGTDDTAGTGTVHLVDTYLAAYNEPDDARRRELTAAVFASDAHLADPPFEATGHDELGGAFGAVQAQFPGHRFERTSGIDEHHGTARYSWSYVGPDGDEAFGGMDVVSIVDDRIARVVGFIGALPDIGRD